MLTQDMLNISPEQISIIIKPQDTEVKAVEICQLLRRLRNNDLREIDENISKAADMINRLSQDHKANVVSDIIIAKATHATLTIEVTQEDMKAIVTIGAPWGGQHITLEELNQRLENHGIIAGLQRDFFPHYIEKANQLKPGQTMNFDAALGTQPINGTDATFKTLVTTMDERELKPQQRAHGKVDMHDLGEVATVTINTPLIQRTPPTSGTEGFTVFGKKIPPNPGQLLPFDVHEGTAISALDEHILISTIEGIPRQHKGFIAINDILKVNNVDISFGNIDFKGDVVVTGDVNEGMTVVSGGNITIGGCVNSATLQAGGNIEVKQGIFGKKRRDNETLTCHVDAAGKISAQYMQYSKLTANIVNAQTQLLHCDVNAMDSIEVTNSTGSKGTIFGGKITAVNKVSCVELGGNAGSKTQLTLSANLENSREAIYEQQDILNKEFVVLQQLIAAHDKVSSIKSKQEQQQLLNKLKRNIDKKVAIIVDVKKQIANLSEHIESHRDAMTIITKGTLYDGVHITIDDQQSQILEQYKAIKIALKNNTIAISSLSEN